MLILESSIKSSILAWRRTFVCGERALPIDAHSRSFCDGTTIICLHTHHLHPRIAKYFSLSISFSVLIGTIFSHRKHTRSGEGTCALALNISWSLWKWTTISISWAKLKCSSKIPNLYDLDFLNWIPCFCVLFWKPKFLFCSCFYWKRFVSVNMIRLHVSFKKHSENGMRKNTTSACVNKVRN